MKVDMFALTGALMIGLPVAFMVGCRVHAKVSAARASATMRSNETYPGETRDLMVCAIAVLIVVAAVTCVAFSR